MAGGDTGNIFSNSRTRVAGFEEGGDERGRTNGLPIVLPHYTKLAHPPDLDFNVEQGDRSALGGRSPVRRCPIGVCSSDIGSPISGLNIER